MIRSSAPAKTRVLGQPRALGAAIHDKGFWQERFTVHHSVSERTGSRSGLWCVQRDDAIAHGLARGADVAFVEGSTLVQQRRTRQ